MPTSPSSRPRRSWRGYAVRGVALGAVLLAGTTILLLRRPRPARPPAPRPAVEPRELGTSLEPLRQALNSVVAVEAAGPNGRRTLGAGLVLDAEGHVLTCLHVVVKTAYGGITFRNTVTYEIEGCTAVDPRLDLAIIKIRSPPPQLEPFQMATDDRLHRAAYAVGHPAEKRLFTVQSGRLLQALTAADLTEENRRFLESLTPGGEELRWLRHSAALDDGFSGGPLLTADGKVLGLNVWVDDGAGFGYALDRRELEAFLAAPRREPIPLARLALPEVRARAERWQLSATRLTRIFDHARALNWQPANFEDYQILRQLAAGMTLARQPDLLAADGVLATQTEALAVAADKAAAELRRRKWGDAGQLTLINEFASHALMEPLGGLFAFAQVVEIRNPEADNPDVIFRLAGFEERFLVPFVGQLQTPEVGDSFLLLGMIQPESAASKLPRVVCHTFISLAKP